MTILRLSRLFTRSSIVTSKFYPPFQRGTFLLVTIYYSPVTIFNPVTIYYLLNLYLRHPPGSAHKRSAFALFFTRHSSLFTIYCFLTFSRQSVSLQPFSTRHYLLSFYILCIQKTSLQQCLHVSTAVGDQENVYTFIHHSVNYAVGFEKNFSIITNA
jgi:hypothetical protein